LRFAESALPFCLPLFVAGVRGSAWSVRADEARTDIFRVRKQATPMPNYRFRLQGRQTRLEPSAANLMATSAPVIRGLRG
jgi:hypothetical protein